MQNTWDENYEWSMIVHKIKYEKLSVSTLQFTLPGHYVWVKKLTNVLEEVFFMDVIMNECGNEWKHVVAIENWEGDIISNTKGLTMLLLHFIISIWYLFLRTIKKACDLMILHFDDIV